MYRPGLAAEHKFTDIVEAGFYAPIEDGELPLGAKYFPAGCKVKEFGYAAYVDPDRIGTPFSSLPGVPTYQIYKLSNEGKTLSADLTFDGHTRVQATLQFKEYTPNKRLVYEGIYQSPKTKIERLATMTFEKVGENGLRGFAMVGKIRHGEFLLERVKSHNEAYLMFAKMGAEKASSLIAAQFKKLCGERPKQE